MVAPKLRVGDLVTYRGGHGIARVGDLQGSNVRIDYFESVALPVAESAWVRADECRRPVLAPETRVYWTNPDTGGWLAGRVKGRQGPRYFVQFPNTAYDLPVHEHDLRVRWDRPVSDPVQVLISGGNESGYFYDARLPVLRSLVEQRAACASVPALLSSAVEIYPHQVRAALTVLADPVQRYLFADEVGLGKTIEAGYVIRQTLIDDSRARITVLTPDTLRRQWLRELTELFFIDDFPLARIKLTPHEEPGRWAEYLDSDLVVVDEAHRLAQVSEPGTSPYRELCELVHSSPRLLLLSATPVTSGSVTHLALLHLLDPHMYRWDDRQAFEHRQALRSELANGVYALDPTFTFLLPSTIEGIRALLPADPRFETLAAQVMQLLGDDEGLRDESDAPVLAARVEALRAHISETYRLHRRTIRHRRAQVLRDDEDSMLMPYEVRGRVQPKTLELDSSEGRDAHDMLLAWRTRVWDHLLDEGMTEAADPYALMLGVLASRTSGPGGDLLDAMRWRLSRDEAAADRAGLSSHERHLLSAPTLVCAESDLLADFESRLAETDRTAGVQAIVDALLPVFRRGGPVVVFCGPGSLATDLAVQLRTRFPRRSVGEHTRAVGADQSERTVVAWMASASTILVADETAEDGLNLQSARAAVHLRVPWSPNQLEQRLGRIDRYPGTVSAELHAPASQYILGDTGHKGSIYAAWLSLLRSGYEVFSASVSTLQDAIAQGLAATWKTALTEGADGLEGSVERVRAELGHARAEIDKIDMLESIHEGALHGRDVAAAVGEIEQDWRAARDALLRYVSDSGGGIKLRHSRRKVNENVREFFDVGGSRPLIDPRLFAMKSARMTSDMTQGTFNRSAALRARGTRLFRPGNPFVDMIGSVIDIDDRGQATAFRRIDPRYRGEPAPFFGFDFLVEADIKSAASLVSDRAEVITALRRQADRILPPFMLKVWIPAGMEGAVTSDAALAWLDRLYDNRTDRSYNAKLIHQLVDLFGGWLAFRNSAEAAQQAARRQLEKVTDLSERCLLAERQARQDFAVAEAQAEARRAAGRLVEDTESHLLDVSVTDALISGLSQPDVRVVAAACVVRSGYERKQLDA